MARATDTQHSTKAEPTAAPEGTSRALNRFVVRGLEFAVAVVLVFLFFLTFLGIISFSFPQGQSLRELMVHPRWIATPTDSSGFEVEEAPQQEFVAQLVETKRQVKAKDPRAIVWSSAENGMGLGNRYSVQTLDRSSAGITIGDVHRFDLGENSLVVIRDRRSPQTQATRRPRSTVAFAGSLDLTGHDDDAGSVPLEFVAANGAKAWLPDAATASELRMTVNPDKSATFALRKGSARVTSGGKTVPLASGHAVTADGFSAPQAPVRLPETPIPTAPTNAAAWTYRSLPPRVRFEWAAQSSSDGYRIEIARDPGFKDVVHEQRVNVAEFTHGNLPEGPLYWRVSSFRGWAEGRPSKGLRLNMMRDLTAPPLDVDFPTETIWSERVVLRGITEPGAQLFVDGRSTVADASGAFERAVDLRRGVNVVVVEAMDIAGNVSYRSELLNAKY